MFKDLAPPATKNGLLPTVPLAGYALFETSDVDEARSRVAEIFCPHRLEVVGKHPFNARHHHLPGDKLSINYIDYGSKTLISPGFLEDFYLLQIPLSGSAMINHGGRSVSSGPRLAALLNPHLSTTMIWSESCPTVLLQVRRRALEQHLFELLGHNPTNPLTFDGPVDLNRPSARSLCSLIAHIANQADLGNPMIGTSNLTSRHLEETLMSALLEAGDHNYTNFLRHPSDRAAAQKPGVPQHLTTAVDFIRANLDEPLTLTQIASAAATNPRTLQLAFKKHYDATPMQFLRRLRLEEVHRELMSPSPRLKVTDVALRWGFTHLSRFSAVYTDQFGRTPSETLAAAQFLLDNDPPT